MSLNMSVEVLVFPKLTEAMRVGPPLGNESHVCCQCCVYVFDLSTVLCSLEAHTVVSLTRVMMGVRVAIADLW